MEVAEITEAAQYLTFKLGEEHFAIDVSKVREILELTKITKVPRTPEFMNGVINLRGSVVPVVDLRLSLAMERVENTIDTCIIVMEVSMNEETVVLGALADSVQEVLDMDPGDIEPPPKVGKNLRSEFIKGMGKRNDQFIIILNIDKVFTAKELTIVEETKDRISPEKVKGGVAVEV